MTEALTFIAQEIGRAFALVWGGIGIAVKLNYEVMSVVVTLTSRIVQLLFLLTQKSAQVCSILASDLLLFMGDIGSGVIALYTTMSNLGKGLINAVLALVTSAYAACVHIYELIGSFHSFIINIFMYIYFNIGSALNAFKHGFVLFGSSVTFAISFLPKLLYLLTTNTFQLFVDVYLECCLFLQNSFLSFSQMINNFEKSVTEYFTDIPISAVLGFCIGIIILVALKYLLQYVIANFIIVPEINLSSIGNSVKRRVIDWLACMRENNFQPEQNNDVEDEVNEYDAPAGSSSGNEIRGQLNLLSRSSSSSSLIHHTDEETNNHNVQPVLTRRPLTRRQRTLGLATNVTDEEVSQNVSPSKCKDKKNSPTSNRDLNWAKGLYKELQDERDGKLCIICQDRVKRVILLPCRHLCLCDACRSAVIMRDNNCPICRKPILDSLRVYL